MKKVVGNGVISLTDYKTVKWVGETKGGKAVQIELYNALNMGSMELAYADKGEIVSEITFTGTYLQSELDAGIKKEPFAILSDDDVTAGAAEIMLGAGKFYIDGACIGLSRGGGKFARGLTIREIAADNDRGAVKGRVTIDEGRPTLSINALEILTKLTNMYPALEEEENGDIHINDIDNMTLEATEIKTVNVITTPTGCTLTAAVLPSGEEVSASITDSVLTVTSTAATVGDVFTITVLATKTDYTAQAKSFTVKITA